MESIQTNAIYNANPLDLMERMEDDSVDLIILDPPWGTSLEGDEAISEHRLLISNLVQQSYRILRKTGSLFCTANSNLNIGIKPVLTAIFGEENFRFDYILPRKRSHIFHGPDYEIIIHFSKSNNYVVRPPTRLLTKREKEEKYPFSDEHGRYRLEPLTSHIGERNRFQWMDTYPPENQSWRYSKEKLDELSRHGKIFFSGNTKFPRLKNYVDENSETLVGSIWDDLDGVRKFYCVRL